MEAKQFPIAVAGVLNVSVSVYDQAWRGVLDPVIARYAERDILPFFRADAAYAIPALYERLEEADYFYANRLPANNDPDRDVRDWESAKDGSRLARRDRPDHKTVMRTAVRKSATVAAG